MSSVILLKMWLLIMMFLNVIFYLAEDVLVGYELMMLLNIIFHLAEDMVVCYGVAEYHFHWRTSYYS